MPSSEKNTTSRTKSKFRGEDCRSSDRSMHGMKRRRHMEDDCHESLGRSMKKRSKFNKSPRHSSRRRHRDGKKHGADHHVSRKRQLSEKGEFWTNDDIDYLLESALDEEPMRKKNKVPYTVQRIKEPVKYNVVEDDIYDPQEDDQLLWDMYTKRAEELRKSLKESESKRSKSMSYDDKMEAFRMADERISPISNHLYFYNRISKEEYKELMTRTVLEVSHAIQTLSEGQLHMLVDTNLYELRRIEHEQKQYLSR